MTTTPKRKAGRPRKAVEEVNPDHEFATKEYVKCIGRKYHAKQTQYILEHRRESTIIQTGGWLAICIGAGIWYWLDVNTTSLVVFVVSLALLFNSIMVVSGYLDTIRNSKRKGIGFLQEYKCTPQQSAEWRAAEQEAFAQWYNSRGYTKCE